MARKKAPAEPVGKHIRREMKSASVSSDKQVHPHSTAHVCTQRVLPAERRKIQIVSGGVGSFRAVAPIGKSWLTGTRLRVKFLGGTTAQQQSCREQAGWWSSSCNIFFDFDAHATSDIRITFDASGGAWSYLGTDAKSIAQDQPTMNLGFEDGGTAAHEFGHAIGLAHEHQNPAGGIEWNEEVVINALAQSPNFWTEAETRHNVLNKYAVDQIKGTEFDPESIMLYFFPGTWTKSGQGTAANSVLSAMDKSFVAGANMYPRSKPTAATATPIQVNASAPSRAAIGQFGEEDIFSFKVDSPGPHIIETLGSTDVVMKLFGPSDPNDLIAVDDDSGFAQNARISKLLGPGHYWVQVRHYNSNSGIGSYSILVKTS